MSATATSTEIDVVTGEIMPAGLITSRLSPAETRERAQWVREVTGAALTKDVDYGIIPGTDKPALLKPGAEMLLLAAGLGFQITKIDDEDSRNHQGVTYRCTVRRGDLVVAECDGYAGYDESRFYTSAADAEAKERANAERYRRQVNTAKFTEYRAPWNSVIKMAQKRALVGAALNAVAGSGLFTQDLDDDIGSHPAQAAFNGHALMEPFLKALNATSKKELTEWRKAEGLPASTEMSPEQAAVALVKIGELLARQETPNEGGGSEGAGGKGSPATTEAHEQAGPSEADNAGEPAPESPPTAKVSGSPGGNGSSAAPGPDTAPRLITTKQAQRLHVIAQGLDETVLRVLIFSATNGTSDSANHVPVGKYDTVCDQAERAKQGELPNGYTEVAERYAAWLDTQAQAS